MESMRDLNRRELEPQRAYLPSDRGTAIFPSHQVDAASHRPRTRSKAKRAPYRAYAGTFQPSSVHHENMSTHTKVDLIRVADLKAGERVDLDGDSIADNGEHPEFEFEYEVVESVEVETPECVLVTFESGFSCGFPTEHSVFVSCRCASAEHGRACPFAESKP